MTDPLRKSLLGIGIGLIVLAAIGYFSYITKTGEDVVPNQPTSPLAGPIDVEGVMVCLPHKNTRGPQTMECAFGLKDTEGRYYGLRDTDPQYRNISQFSMQEPIRVIGTFQPQVDSKYQSIGVIAVSSVVTIPTE